MPDSTPQAVVWNCKSLSEQEENVIREFEVNSGTELNVNAGPVGPQIDLRADLYLPGDTTITQYDLFSNLGSGIKREDYVHIIDEYWVD